MTRSYRDMITRHLAGDYNPNNNPWDPPLRVYFPRRPSKPSINVRGRPTVDGGMRGLVWGGGRDQRVPLPIYKHKAPRKS